MSTNGKQCTGDCGRRNGPDDSRNWGPDNICGKCRKAGREPRQREQSNR